MFATIGAADREEAACAECTVLLKLLYVRNEFHITQLKILGIIEQGTIDASHVGSLYVAILVASFPQWLLGDEVVEHVGVLHLRKSDNVAPLLSYLVGSHLSQHR